MARIRTVHLYDDNDADAYEAALEELSAARAAGTPDVADWAQKVVEARSRLRDTATPYTFKNLARSSYKKMLADHPPTDADHAAVRADGGDKALWAVETFPRALIQACAVDPALTEADVDALFQAEGLNDAELGYLFAAAYEVNTQRRVVAL